MAAVASAARAVPHRASASLKINPEVTRLIAEQDWFGLARFYGLNVEPVSLDGWHIAGVLWFLAAYALWRYSVRLLNRPKIPWKLGKLTVDLIGGQDTIHAGLGGTSGKGKSSALIPLLAYTDKPVVAFGFDKSVPLEEWWDAHADDERYVKWEMNGTFGWDIMSGPPLEAADGLTAGFERSENDTGYFRGLARNRLMDLIQDDDRQGRQRNLWRYVDLMRMGGPDGEQNRACRRWAGSFETLLKTLGPALGNDFNVIDALKAGKRVLVMPNRFRLSETADLVGGIALVQVRRAAEEVGNFLVFIEEAGQARAYEKDMATLFQAGRTRGCPMILITQNLSKLKEQITNNISVWVVFGQRTDREADAAATYTRVDPEEFFGMPRGVCWVRVEERPAVRLKLPLVKPPKGRKLAVSQPPDLISPDNFPNGYTRQTQKQLDGWRPTTLALPARTAVVEIPAWVGRYEDRQRAYGFMQRDEEPSMLWTPDRGFWTGSPCLRWTGAQRAGRGLFRVDSETKTIYRLTYEWAGGKIPASYQLDHLCANPACCEPDHLEAVTAQDNIRRRDGRKRALKTYQFRDTMAGAAPASL